MSNAWAITLFAFSIVSGCSNAPTPDNHIRIKVCNAPGSVESADFNNDGFPDLAITSETDSAVVILMGTGNGTFIRSPGSPFFAGHLPNDIAIADFNKDGSADLAFANHEKKSLSVLLGDGKGQFNQAAHSPFSVDVVPHTHGAAVGDFNSDGNADLVTDSWGNDKVAILYGDSTQLFKETDALYKVGRHPYQRLRVADVNKDGISDIITTNLEGESVTVLLCDGKGNFTNAESSTFPCGDAPFGVAVSDLNGDGNADLAIINSPASTGGDIKGANGLTVLIGNAKGSFMTLNGSPFNAGSIPNRVATGDVDGNGVNDVVVSDNSSNQIYLYLMSKKGLSSISPITVGNHPKGLAVVDLNNDGKKDIIVCNNADNDISIIISECGYYSGHCGAQLWPGVYCSGLQWVSDFGLRLIKNGKNAVLSLNKSKFKFSQLY